MEISKMLNPEYDPVEYAIIAALLTDSECRKKILAIVDGTDIVGRECNLILNAARKMATEGLEADIISVTMRLQGKLSFQEISNIIGIESTNTAIDNYIMLLKEKSAKRKADDALLQYGVDGDINKLKDTLLNLSTRRAIGVLRFSEFSQEMIKEIWRTDYENFITYSTGIKELDDKCGQLKPTELMIIAGDPASGKTTWMANMTKYALDNSRDVLVLSADLSKESFTQKLICNYETIDTGKMRRRELLTKEERERYQERCEKLANLNYYIQQISSFNLEQVINAVETHRPNILFVDYIQRFCADKNENRAATYSDIANRLKDLAMRYNMAVVGGSQLTDDGKVKESRGIKEAADHLIMLKTHSMDEQTYVREIECVLDKGRWGVSNSMVKVRFVPQFGHFTSINNFSDEAQ